MNNTKIIMNNKNERTTYENAHQLLWRQAALSNIKGKFLLSSYDSGILKEYTKLNNWDTIRKEMNLCMSNKGDKKKIEMLTANFKIKSHGE
jgi:hypothetical protein